MDIIFSAIITILIVTLVIHLTLEVINFRSSKSPIPEILTDIYDSENYQKQQMYKRETTKLSVIESVVGSALLIAFFSIGGFGIIHNKLIAVTNNQILQTLLFFGALGLLSLTMSTPFSYYSNFVIEARYGFNKTTLKTFVFDIFKSITISTILGGIIIALITWVFIKYQNLFWVLTLSIILVFSLIMNALYSSVILPIFNKKTPLEDGELKQKVVQFASKIGFSINDIFIIDGSRRSSKANAFFTGFGRRKRIFIYDTLIDKLNTDEILAVIAHELGHDKRHHIWINIGLGFLNAAAFLYAFNYIALNSEFTRAMGFNSEDPVFHLSLLCFVLLIEPIQLVIGIFSNMLSRKMEYQADHFAAVNGMGYTLIQALKKLSSMNYSNLTPHRIYVAVNYSHPTLLNRILAIINGSKK